MAAKQDSEDFPIMPQNLKELVELLPSIKKEDLPHAGAVDFAIKSFQIHRPIGKVMIVLMGQSGTGKSSTINNLFGDSELCPTHTARSKTCKVTECEKLITFSDLKFKAFLSLVDTPGTFETVTERNENYMTLIQEFRSKHSAFLTESDHIVYPNLVLITVNASDTRLGDENSRFIQTLRTIQETRLLDINRVNLIVAATFAANISTNSDMFDTEKRKIRNVVAKVVFNILGLLNVEIVFVENRPDIHNLQKKVNCDFYELPDGELIPLNLFDAICRQLKKNRDFFGSVITSRYFNEDCPEKKDIVVPRPLQNYEEPDDKLNNSLSQKLTDFCQEEGNSCSSAILQFVGSGYSSIDECTKSFVITDSACLLSKSLALREKRIYNLNFANIEEYKKYRIQHYGLESTTEMKFSPEVHSVGRWRNKSDLDIYISFVFEEKLGTKTFSVGFQRSSLVSELQSDLDNLPCPSWIGRISGTVNDQFCSFVNKWGTHYIKEVGIGGSIRVDCCSPSEWTEEQRSDLEERIQSKLASLANQEEFEGDFDNIGGYVWVTFRGGIQPSTRKLSEVTPQIFAEWSKSLKKYPAELENLIKLQSYEVFLDDNDKKTSFRVAALNYLRCCPQKLTAKRSDEAKRAENAAKAGLTAAAAVVGALAVIAFVMKK